MKSNGRVRVTPHPGRDEYIIAIVATVDGLELATAPSKEKFIDTLLAKIIYPGLVREILGKAALAKLVPKDRRRALTNQYIDKCLKEEMRFCTEDLGAFLRQNGVTS